MTNAAGTAFTLTPQIQRSPTATFPTYSGTIALSWTQTVAVMPAGSPAIAIGDIWTIVVNGTPYTVLVKSQNTSAGTWTFTLNGATDTTIANGSTDAATIASALAAAIGAGATASGGTVVVTASNHSPVPTGPLTEGRNSASVVAPSETNSPTTIDTRVHYSSATLALQGSWQPSELWTLTVNGVQYQYTVSNTDVPDPNQQTLSTIAAKLATKYTTSAHDSAITVVASGSSLTVTDTSAGTTHAFSVSVNRGGSGVTGVIDIDNANIVSGSVQVPVVLPQWQWIVQLFPWAASFFTITDTLGFTAYPEFDLISPNGTVLRQVRCTIDPRTNACSSTPDLGSTNLCTIDPTTGGCSQVTDLGNLKASDPFLEYTFPTNGAGTYVVKVGSYVVWNNFTDGLGVANTFHQTGDAGVVAGAHYTLFVSLQQHDVNESALSLDGKRITIVSGPGAGQTATITHYEPATATYTLDTKWSTPPGPGSRFEISEPTSALPGYTPSTDQYQVVLTKAPTQNVYVDVTPQPTPTYNSAQAFDPAANYGQNNLVQVRVQTPRAVFLLTGIPAAGETWTIMINDRAFSYHVADAAHADLGTIATNLCTALAGATGYTITCNASGHQITVEGPAFYAGFTISHDLDGGGVVSPAATVGAAITLTGEPAAGEVWTLHLDSSTITYTANANDTLSSIAQALAALIPSSYSKTVAGPMITVARSGTGSVAASVTVGAPSVGTSSASNFFTQSVVNYSGEPVSGETWAINVNGGQYSVVSNAGESLQSVVNRLAQQINDPFVAVGVGLDSIYLYSYFFFFSVFAFGTVQLDSSHAAYGSATVAGANPIGVNVSLSGSPVLGETWTLNLDGTPYGYAVHTGDSVNTVAQAIAALIPQSPQPAGGPYYAVTRSSAVLTITRIDETAPVAASIVGLDARQRDDRRRARHPERGPRHVLRHAGRGRALDAHARRHDVSGDLERRPVAGVGRLRARRDDPERPRTRSASSAAASRSRRCGSAPPRSTRSARSCSTRRRRRASRPRPPPARRRRSR